jgi:DNA-binding NarL/FixJ family response regulator
MEDDMTATGLFRDDDWAGLAARLLRTEEGDVAVRVLVVDDHLLFAEMLTFALELGGRFEVVGHARNGREAIEQAAWLRPDVVVMDLQMPVLDGIDATPRVLAAAPGAKVVMVSSSQSPGDPARAREAGAVAFLGKDASVEDLVRALEHEVFRVIPLRSRRAAHVSADQPFTP